MLTIDKAKIVHVRAAAAYNIHPELGFVKQNVGHTLCNLTQREERVISVELCSPARATEQ